MIEDEDIGSLASAPRIYTCSGDLFIIIINKQWQLKAKTNMNYNIK